MKIMDLFFCSYAKNGMLQSDFDKILHSSLILYRLNIILVGVIMDIKNKAPCASKKQEEKDMKQRKKQLIK